MSRAVATLFAGGYFAALSLAVVAYGGAAEDGRSHARVVGRGQVRFDGAGPERWAMRYRRAQRRYRVEHRRFVLEQRHRRRVQRELRHARAARLLQSHDAEPAAGSVGYWRARQIAAAEVLGRESGGDPWPNCPDPYDGSGAGWDDTVQCENSGNWLDSPGFYRCGLQFDPAWESRFGRLCP